MERKTVLGIKRLYRDVEKLRNAYVRKKIIEDVDFDFDNDEYYKDYNLLSRNMLKDFYFILSEE